MTTIRLSAGAILAFDGTVVEFFWATQSQRAHVGAINRIQVDTDRKGKHGLNIVANLRPGENMAGAFLSDTFDDQVYAQVNAMVAEIQTAMASFRADND
jgi:hypothetical protein